MKLIDVDPIVEKYRNYKFQPEWNDYEEGFRDGCIAIVNELKDAPEIPAKPIVYAHWILEREPDDNPYCYHCSHCDSDFHNIGIKCVSKYFPDCGATMAREIEDETN